MSEPDAAAEVHPIKKGDRIRRVKDGRIFRVTFVNRKPLNGNGEVLFSADSADGGRSHAGGYFHASEYVIESSDSGGTASRRASSGASSNGVSKETP